MTSTYSNPMTPSVATPKVGKVQAAVDDLEAGVTQLEKAVDLLEQRLKPILSLFDDGSFPGIEPAVDDGVELAQWIRQRSVRLSDSVRKINQLFNRIEL
jgi:tetrahydromethanopterin S-methyltransferase subunit B